MKKHISTILIALVFILGLLIMLYPTLSNMYNEQMNSYVLTNYIDEVENKTEEEYAAMFEEARAFNATLPGSLSLEILTDEFLEEYNSVMDVRNGAIGYLKIDKIDVNLAIYHGSDTTTLQQYIGHLEGSAFPIGDEGDHTILTGHTGLPSAELLTDLTEMEVGDTFEVIVLNKTFKYEVYEINVVEPEEVDNLVAVEGKSIVTLVTCTPYGVNSHRLLVHGELIEVIEATDDVVESMGDISTSSDLMELLVLGILYMVMPVVAALVYRRRAKR